MRQFMITRKGTFAGISWITCGIVFVLFALLLTDAYAEVRGLWVVRDTLGSSDKIGKMIEFADTNGINVLFVQIRGRGDAYYKSNFVPGPDSHPDIPVTFDPLEEVIRLAHERNIEVHAWFNMYLTWSDDSPPISESHPLRKNPDWFMVSVKGESMAEAPIGNVRNGRSEGRFISPAVEAVRSYLSRVITEVAVAYDIDGVHMDYVRYPGRDYDFHPFARWDFQRRNGVDPVDVIVGDGSVDPALVYLGKWVEYRAEQINRQIRSVRRRITLVDPKIRLSAAVKPHADEAYFQYGQNWSGWVNDGIVDFIVTMSYYTDDTRFREVLHHNTEKVNAEKIVAGIGAYRMKPDSAARQIAIARDYGCSGFCMFSYTTFVENPGYFGKLRRGVGSNETSLPGSFRPYIRGAYE